MYLGKLDFRKFFTKIFQNYNALTLTAPSWLGVVVYWLFLFVVSIILLNLLIAQFSNTYDEELDKARISIQLERAVVLHRIESAVWVWGLYLMAWHCCKKKIAQLVRHTSCTIMSEFSLPNQGFYHKSFFTFRTFRFTFIESLHSLN